MCFSVGIERNLSQLAKLFDAKVDKLAFERVSTLSEEYPKEFKVPADDDRLYPHVFGPVIIGQKNTDKSSELVRVIKPMRYRIRPSDAYEEVPSKFNLFNARLDSLENRKTWRPLFGFKHGLFPYKRFYEWVESQQDDGKAKQLVSFKAKEHEFLMAPVLYDYFKEGEKSFLSFAIITTDPPPEVLEAGHDRCPIFLKEEYWQDWLNPMTKNKDQLYSMLRDPLRPFYDLRIEEDLQRPREKTRQSSSQLSLFSDNE